MKTYRLLAVALGLGYLSLGVCQTAPPVRKITTPKEAFGFDIGDDYHLANYVQLTSYWQTLAKESDRMKLVDMGPTAEGRREYMAIISSPDNMVKLDHYKDIAEKLAHAESLTDAEAHVLSEEGRAVVWIDGGLHASETVGAQQLIETVYRLNSLTDPETMRILHDDIVLCVLANRMAWSLYPTGITVSRFRRSEPLKAIRTDFQCCGRSISDTIIIGIST